MVTFYPGFRRVAGGFMPVVRVRNSEGKMIGSKTKRGYVFVSAAYAESEANIAALRAALRFPNISRVAAK